MIEKIKPSRSEKVIFAFIIILAIFSFGSFFLIKDKCLFVKDYDPKIALVASDNGKSDIEAIFKIAPSVLSKSGMLAMEFGLGQSTFINEKCKDLFTDTLIKKDLSGVRRFFIGKLKD